MAEDITDKNRSTEANAAEQDAIDPELPAPRGSEVESVLEALLFAATQAYTVSKLGLLMNGVPDEEVAAALEKIRARYAQPTSGLMLMEVAGGWQVATRTEVADWILRLHKHRRRTALSPALLETLSIVAYKQPLTRAEVESIRGVDCGSVLRSLQDAGLVEIMGRKEVLGRPPIYGTTDVFLKTFGLKDLEQLPSIGELKGIVPKADEAPKVEEAAVDSLAR
ncbi:SMC-Scp complex subunit ScpB [Candidatus Sumerlaeota bacterium]|nr:SMC-Scp complex subunit ScpB [Candidatus Sumerlaeota bacterium]